MKKLKNLIVNNEDISKIKKPTISNNLLAVIKQLFESVNLLDTKVNKLEAVNIDIDTKADQLKPIEVDTKADQLKPIEVDTKADQLKPIKPIEVDTKADQLKPIKPIEVDTTEKKKISSALHTKISSKQKKNLRKGDSVADILARIFQSMNENRIEMIKHSEHERNFKDEHVKEKTRNITKQKKVTYKKHRTKDKSGLGAIFLMGIIANFGDIVKWVESLAEPFTSFITKIKTEFENFDIVKKTEELAGVITSFLSDMKQTLFKTVDTFLNKWVDELLGWIEEASGNIIQFNRENIPRSNLSGSVYRTPEGDQKTADMVKEFESNGTKTPGQTPKQTPLDTTISTVSTVASGFADTAVHLGGTVASSIVKDMKNMAGETLKADPSKLTPVEHTALKQKATHLAKKKQETEVRGFNVPLIKSTQEMVDEKKSDTIMNDIMNDINSLARPSDAKPIYKGPLSEVLNKEIPTYKKPTMSWNGDVPVPPTNITTPTTPSVNYNREQKNNNNLINKGKSFGPKITQDTSPPKNVDLRQNSNSSSGGGISASVLTCDPTLTSILISNLCKV